MCLTTIGITWFFAVLYGCENDRTTLFPYTYSAVYDFGSLQGRGRGLSHAKFHELSIVSRPPADKYGIVKEVKELGVSQFHISIDGDQYVFANVTLEILQAHGINIPQPDQFGSILV